MAIEPIRISKPLWKTNRPTNKTAVHIHIKLLWSESEIHFKLMRLEGETRFGVFERHLIESALSRPRPAAIYESADLVRQAATLCFGMIKNHPWIGGNQRTATAILDDVLFRNGHVLYPDS